MLDLMAQMSKGPHGWVRPRIVKPSNPPAGSDIRITVPGGKLWQPIALTATYTASAVVQARVPGLYISDGNDEALYSDSAYLLAANQVQQVSWMLGGAPVYSGQNLLVPANAIPPCPLPAGWIIGTLSFGFLGGDQWSAITLWVVEADQESLANRIRTEMATPQ